MAERIEVPKLGFKGDNENIVFGAYNGRGQITIFANKQRAFSLGLNYADVLALREMVADTPALTMGNVITSEFTVYEDGRFVPGGMVRLGITDRGVAYIEIEYKHDQTKQQSISRFDLIPSSMLAKPNTQFDPKAQSMRGVTVLGSYLTEIMPAAMVKSALPPTRN